MSPQVTTESGNRQNVFPVEAQPELIENYSSFGEDAEKANGRWAMIGFIALLLLEFKLGHGILVNR